ncbi:MAG: hypothetical protein OXQ93_16435 [Gemmatimonadota bacterium]|nr:hypothetical protein [Gemmatimonadota bacterium]
MSGGGLTRHDMDVLATRRRIAQALERIADALERSGPPLGPCDGCGRPASEALALCGDCLAGIKGTE